VLEAAGVADGMEARAGGVLDAAGVGDRMEAGAGAVLEAARGIRGETT
jgi:hypothetical protein